MTNNIFRLATFVAFACSTYLLVAACAPRAALAQAPPPPTVTEAEHPRRTVSVTISPIHLLSPIVELTGEARLLDKLGVALIAGAGKVSVTPDFGSKTSAPVWEVGTSVRYYVVGDFRHGMQLGAEIDYLHASLTSEGVSASGAGIATGGFLGYKVMADVGFTFDAQLGYQFIGVGGSATATSSDGRTTVSSHDSTRGPLLNLNVGWSF